MSDSTTFRFTADHIRLNPGMYIGNVDSTGLHYLLFKLIRNSLSDKDFSLETTVKVQLKANGSIEVTYFGLAVPEDTTTLESLFTDGNVYDSLHYKVVNALSDWLKVRLVHESVVHQLEFRQGKLCSSTQITEHNTRNVLKLEFRPDPTIFEETEFDYSTIRQRLQQFAFLNSGLRLSLQHDEKIEHFEFTDGIRTFVELLNQDRIPLNQHVLLARGEEKGIHYEVGLQWCQDDDEQVLAFVNSERTRDPEGTQIAGFRSALTRFMNESIRAFRPSKPSLNGFDTRRGLTAIVSVKMKEPEFLGATKSRLNSKDARWVIEAGVRRMLKEFQTSNPAEVARIIDTAIAKAGNRNG